MVPEDVVPAPPPKVAPVADIDMTHTGVEAEEGSRPGWLVRLAAGAWHVPGGAAFLLRRPRLWGLAALPSALGGIGLVAGLILGVYGVRGVETTLSAHRPRLPDVADLIAALGLWTATLAAGVLGVFALVLFVSAPLLERLERRTEALAGGHASAPPARRGDTLRALQHSLYLLLAVPPAFLIALVPFVGPPIAGVLVAAALALQLTAPSLARRGLDFRAMRRWHRDWRAESLGFGVAALILLPLLSPILAPALATGAALLVHETEGDAPDGAAVEPSNESTDDPGPPSL
jgi:uncharacterized protein involved in cysteine biosynthesis